MRDLDLLNLSEEPRYDSAKLFWLAAAVALSLGACIGILSGDWMPVAVSEVRL